MKLNTVKLILKTDKTVVEGANKVRGYIGNTFKDYPLLHNHYGNDNHLLTYPLVQYKIIGEDVLILGIEEGKYDDAVARLYRATELIAQTGLANEGFIELSRLRDHKIFRIPLEAIENCDNKEAVEYIKGLDDYWYAKKGVVKLALSKSFEFLGYLGCQYAKDYLDDNKLKDMVSKRNDSLLAHGLNPISKDDAENLFEGVLKYAIGVFPEIEKYMEMAKFPKFKE